MANVVKIISCIVRRPFFTASSSNWQYQSAVRYSSVSRDLIRSNKESSAIHTQDIILGSLKSASTTTGILDLVRSHGVVMNIKHIMQALRSLFTLQKNGHSELSTNQILKNKDFELLCKRLKKHSGVIEINDTIEALKVVCYLGVSSDAAIVQVLLHLLRHRINFLSLQQLIFFDFLMDQMKQTPLIQALQLALPIVFEVHVGTKLDRENIQHIAECLHFASRKNVSENCVQFLVNCVMNYAGEIDSKSAMSILWSICEFESCDYFEPIVKKLVNDMLMAIDDYVYQDLDTTLSKLIFRYNHKHVFYYNDIFCDTVANWVMDQDKGVELAVYVLKKFLKVSHTNDRLLDYVSTKIHEDPANFFTADAYTVNNLIVSLSMSDYRPKHWDTLSDYIQKTKTFKLAEKREMIWLKLSTALCALDIYKLDVFETALKPDYLNKIVRDGHVSDLDNFILLRQVILTFKREYSHLLPDKNLVDKVVTKMKIPNSFPLEGPLQVAFGGEKFVKTCMTSNLDHFIDHIIVLNKDGSPFAFDNSNQSKNIEDLKVPEGAQIFAILALQPFHYTTNTKRLKTTTALTLRTLEAKNCIAVPVHIQQWQELADFERIPFLLQLFKSKNEDRELDFRINTL